VTRSSKLPGAKDEELIVEARDEGPQQGATQRPEDEEGLEVEVEQHARSSYVNEAQVCFDWPCVALLALLAWHEDLRAGAPSFGFQHRLVVDRLSATEVHHPDDDYDQAYSKDGNNNHDPGPMLEVALLVVMVQGETTRADLACV